MESSVVMEVVVVLVFKEVERRIFVAIGMIRAGDRVERYVENVVRV